MESKKLSFEVNASQIDFKPLMQKDFLELSMRAISSANPNRNNSWFTKESMEKSKHTFANKPILGYFENNDFVSHNGEWNHDDETGMDYWDTLGRRGERMLGMIRESDPVDVVEGSDGLYWVQLKCVIWVQYAYKQVKRLIKDAKRAKEKGGLAKNVSVEVDITDYEMLDNGVMKINEFNLVGITILGSRNGVKVEPGIEDAGLSVIEIMGKDVFEKQEKGLRLAYEKLDGTVKDKKEEFENMDDEKKVAACSAEEEHKEEEAKLAAADPACSCAEGDEKNKAANAPESQPEGSENANMAEGDKHNCEEEHKPEEGEGAACQCAANPETNPAACENPEHCDEHHEEEPKAEGGEAGAEPAQCPGQCAAEGCANEEGAKAEDPQPDYCGMFKEMEAKYNQLNADYESCKAELEACKAECESVKASCAEMKAECEAHADYEAVKNELGSYKHKEFLGQAYALIASAKLGEAVSADFYKSCDNGEINDLTDLKVKVALKAFDASAASETPVASFNSPVSSPDTMGFVNKTTKPAKADPWSNLKDYVGE